MDGKREIKMGTLTTIRDYPEECDTTGADCLGCVGRTAQATTALMGKPSAEWASALFRQMYSHPTCHQMEHSFIWACGVEPIAAVKAGEEGVVAAA